MHEGISVDADPDRNEFIVRFKSRTMRMPPVEFAKLIEVLLEAAARHVNSNFKDTGRMPEQNATVEALTTTGMDASTDLGAVNILTKMHIGILTINFACQRKIALDYCAQVARCIEQADSGPPPQVM